MVLTEGGADPSAIFEWFAGQPLGIALLLFLLYCLVRGRYFIPEYLYRRQEEHIDRLTEAFDTLSKAVDANVEVAKGTAQIAESTHAIIKGIDEAVRKERRK